MTDRGYTWLILAAIASLGVLLWGFFAAHGPTPPSVQPEKIVATQAPSNRETFESFLEDAYRRLSARDPDGLWFGGVADEFGVTSYAQWTDLSPEGVAETLSLERSLLERLGREDWGPLSADEQTSFDVLEWFLDDRIRSHEFQFWDYCIGPYGFGVHSRVIQLCLDLPMENLDDARDYITRLRGFGAWMEQFVRGLEERERCGVIPPADVLAMTIDDISTSVLYEVDGVSDPRASDFYTSFDQRLRSVSALSLEQRDLLLTQAEEAVRDVVLPALRSLRDHLVAARENAGTDLGVWRYTSGADYYEYLLHHYLTDDVRAADLHALGIAQVDRIRTELRQFAAEQFGWPIDIGAAELYRRIQETHDEYLQGGELLSKYEHLVGTAGSSLSRFFSGLPKSQLAIRIDPEAPPAYYESAPLDRSGPAHLVTSLANAATVTAYDDAVLMYHETVPGHHLQFALALDLNIPTLQKLPLGGVYVQHPPFQAFTEGWALYAERLAYEMGLYDDDPVGNLWRLRLELVRAVRLVADIGLNGSGWSWADAAAYVEEALGQRQGLGAMLRFESAPAQACGYNYGYFKILQLRQRAMDRLGPAFDIREFHAQVLRHGAIPLEILDHLIEQWIEAKLGCS